MNELFTIGYSPHTLDSFLSMLKKFQISALVDVRSSPFSKFKPEFNKDTLKGFLQEHKITYVFLGDYCGARVEDPSCYVDGNVDYKLVAGNQKFKEGLERIKKGMEDFRIALMCAEKDPITCHRTILICRNLRSENIQIRHILDNGNIEEQAESEKRLMRFFKLEADLFRTEQDCLEKAFDRQGKKIAYTKDEGFQDE